MVGARLERNIERRSVRIGTAGGCVAQRLNLGVCTTGPAMEPFAERPSVTHQDGTDGRVGRRCPFGASRKLERPREIHSLGRGRYCETSTPFQNAT